MLNCILKVRKKEEVEEGWGVEEEWAPWFSLSRRFSHLVTWQERFKSSKRGSPIGQANLCIGHICDSPIAPSRSQGQQGFQGS